MKIFNSYQDFKSEKKTIITIGTFDGVHIGHQKIIERLINSCNNDEFESLILTFFPHPRLVLTENSALKSLSTIDEKINLLTQKGIQNLVIQNFDKAFSELSAEEFVASILVKKLNIHKIIIGYDHQFGHNRSANFDDLVRFGKQYQFEVEQISAEEWNDVTVSSTKIRNAVLDGNMVLANHYLGYNYTLTGTVVTGKQLGRTIGFPTANIHVAEDHKLIPKFGVYIVKSEWNQKTVFGIMNIGIKPTLGENKVTIEVHFLDFNADLYHQKITVSLLEYIREEQKFDSFESLKNQIEADKQFAIDYLNKPSSK